ncbi:MAG: hypothetical protein KAS39_01735, partial [Actinomycetia bacterium]|nr:hypothetical protein [Actinomycetes bacterium]
MSGKKIMKRIYGVYKEVKKGETERVSIVVAGTQGVDRDLFIEKLCGQKVGIFESVDYKDYTDKVEEALKKLRNTDFAILIATKNFTFDFISFLICVLESQVPYVVYIKENETEFKSKIKNIIQTDDFEISRNEQETTEKLSDGLGQKFLILGRECPHLSKKAA